LKRISAKTQKRAQECREFRKMLVERVGKCEICGHSERRPRKDKPLECSQLCVHEIACGALRQKALDQPYALLVLCWWCNGNEVIDKGKWSQARQLAVLKSSRPEDYDLVKFNFLVNPRAPSRIEEREVKAWKR
jgi:hypothetical protein